MFKPIQVKALPNYKLGVKYTDGVEGEIDLSHLVGKGVFSLWNNHRAFQKVGSLGVCVDDVSESRTCSGSSRGAPNKLGNPIP